MESKIKFSPPAPGAEGNGTVELEVPTTEQITKWMEKDLAACLAFLNALQNDTAMKEQMAIFLQGRITNFKNKPDPSQTDLFPKRG